MPNRRAEQPIPAGTASGEGQHLSAAADRARRRSSADSTRLMTIGKQRDDRAGDRPSRATRRPPSAWHSETVARRAARIPGRQGNARRASHTQASATPTMIGRLLNIEQDADQRRGSTGHPELEPRARRAATRVIFRCSSLARRDHIERHRWASLSCGNADRSPWHQARFLARASPNSPCGRKTSTITSSVKAMRSRS